MICNTADLIIWLSEIGIIIREDKMAEDLPCWRCLDLEKAQNTRVLEATGKIRVPFLLFFTRWGKCHVCKGTGKAKP